MADDQALDLEVGEAEDAPPTEGEEKKGKSKLLIMIVGGVLVLLIAGGVAGFFLMGGEETSEAAEEQVVEEKKSPAMYIPLKPPFVTQFMDSGRKRYLQLEITLMTRSDDGYQNVIRHLPKIRNNVLSLVSTQLFDEIKTTEGKEIMREALREEIQQIMEAETEDPGIEDVYYTTFIIQ